MKVASRLKMFGPPSLIVGLAVGAVLEYLRIIGGFSNDATRISDTVGATGVLASTLTVLLVVYQILVSNRIAEKQNELISEQTRIAKQELMIAERQTAILENQERILQAKSTLWLGFAGGRKIHHLPRSGNITGLGILAIPFVIGNSGPKAYVGEINLQLYLHDDAEGKILDMRPSGFPLIQNATYNEQTYDLYASTVSIVAVPGQAHNLPLKISFPGPDISLSAYRISWQISSPDGVFPGNDEIGELRIIAS